MLRKTSALSISFALSLVAACASTSGGSHVAARVMSLSRGATDSTGIVPVANARVALQCPARETRQLGVTEQDGSLRLYADEPVSLDCALDVSHEGLRPKHVAVTEVCTTQAGGLCRALDLRAVLQPDGKATQAAAAH
jgi:hypothetical protein